MTITLELTPKEEAILRQQAKLRGMDVKTLLLEFADAQASVRDRQTDLIRFEALLEQAAQDGPGLPDEALTSDGIYRDHP